MPDYRKSAAPRALRVADEIKRIVGQIFDSKIEPKNVDLVTVTQVTMSRDLKNASIYISMLNPAPDAKAVLRDLRSRKKKIRYMMGTELQTKYVPQIKLFIDESIERSTRINTIIEELHGDNPKS